MKKKITSLFWAIVMVITMLPMTAFATSTTDAITVSSTAIEITANNKAEYDGKTITGTYALEKQQGSRIIIDGCEVSLTFNDLKITDDASYTGQSLVRLQNGATLNLTIIGENYLKAYWGGAGIEVPDGCTLNITAESTGTLTAIGGDDYGGGAGIGSKSNRSSLNTTLAGEMTSCGTINIHGGTIIAQGGTAKNNGVPYAGAAGIGGATETAGVSDTGSITITGGNVTATGGALAAGIGGGAYGQVKDITISGGIVRAIPTAVEGHTGAAIGSGYCNILDAATGATPEEHQLSGGNILFTGGSVFADGNIGYGSEGSINAYTGGSVTIKDTNLTITGEILTGTTDFRDTMASLDITIYDPTLSGTGSLNGTMKIGTYEYAIELNCSDYTAKKSVKFTLPSSLTGETDVSIVSGERNYSGALTLENGKTSYELIIGESTVEYNFKIKVYDARLTALGTGYPAFKVLDTSVGNYKSNYEDYFISAEYSITLPDQKNGELDVSFTVSSDKTYTGKAKFTDGSSNVDIVIGTPLVKVTLMAYSAEITGDISGATVSNVKQNGIPVNQDAAAGITSVGTDGVFVKTAEHSAAMTVYMPASDNTDLTVTIPGLNNGEPIEMKAENIYDNCKLVVYDDDTDRIQVTELDLAYGSIIFDGSDPDDLKISYGSESDTDITVDRQSYDVTYVIKQSNPETAVGNTIRIYGNGGTDNKQLKIVLQGINIYFDEWDPGNPTNKVGVIDIDGNADVAITLQGTNTIQRYENVWQYYNYRTGIAVTKGATVSFDGDGTLNMPATSTSVTGACIGGRYNGNGMGTVIINGGTFNLEPDSSSVGIGIYSTNASLSPEGGFVKITGGSITIKHNGYYPCIGSCANVAPDVEITGGRLLLENYCTRTDKSAPLIGYSCNIKISGGTIETYHALESQSYFHIGSNGSLIITGGTLRQSSSGTVGKEIILDSSIVPKNETGETIYYRQVELGSANTLVTMQMLKEQGIMSYGVQDVYTDENGNVQLYIGNCTHDDHSFTTKASASLASSADCQSRAKYYVQCDNCNAVSDTLTVEVGEFGNHNWDTAWSKDGDNHWHKCLVVGCTEIEDEKGHFSDKEENKATYTKRAICDECGIEYGDVVTDDVKPEGTITVYGNIWREFLNKITSGIFFKDTQAVEITTSDVGLGVNKAEYIFTETVYADADAVLNDTGIAWQALTLDADGNTDFNIVPNEKGIVYLKITDKAGNVTVIRSDKITIDNIAPVINGIEDGKTYCGEVVATVSDEYFDRVTVGGSDVTVVDGKFTVTPVTGAQEIKAYDKAGNITTFTITVNDGHTYIYDDSTSDTIVEKCQHCDYYASAQIKVPVGALTYNGSAHKARIVYVGTLSCTNNLCISYGAASDTIGAGEYTASITLGGKTASVKFTVNKAKVNAPAIGSKAYNGSAQVADVTDTELYTVTANEGGTDIGKYDVVLTLRNSANYKWADSDEVSITLKFEITKATNEWVGEPSIRGWTYGESVNAPEAEANLGTVLYTFCDAEGNELTGEPKDAGNYKVRVFVPETDNYTSITKVLPFTIEQRKVTVKWTAPDSLVYDGTAKAPFVRYDQGPIDDDAPEIRFALTHGCDNVNVGTFTFTATGITDSNYVLSDELESPEYTITARPLQQSDFTAATDGLVYNGSAIAPAVESTTNLVTAEDYTVAYENNVNAGENTAKIIINGKKNATGSVEILFSIAKADYPNIVWPQNLVGNHGDKLSTVSLIDGFTWDNPDEVIKYGNGHEYAVTYTPEDTANYKIAQGLATVNGADVTAPAGTVTIGENSWDALWNDITFGLFFKETQTVEVTAEDTESGITATEYYLASGKTEDFADVQWTAFDGSFDINPDNKYVVYIRITNGAGYKTIINSDGVVLDSIAPVISGIENGKGVYGDATFTVDENNLDTVTLDGNKVDAVEGKYTIVADNAEHTVVVTDQSGNNTEYKLTVYKNYTVTLVIDGKEITKLVVGHGKDAELPEIPAKDGYTARWNADGKNITADTTIAAEYTAIPDNDSPQTGDNSNMALWIALLFISGMGLVGTTLYGRKKRQAR